MKVIILDILSSIFVYEFIGLIFGLIYFSDNNRYSIYEWILYIPGASFSIMSFMIIPIATIICIIPVIIDPNQVSLTFLTFGIHSTLSMIYIFNKETNTWRLASKVNLLLWHNSNIV